MLYSSRAIASKLGLEFTMFKAGTQREIGCGYNPSGTRIFVTHVDEKHVRYIHQDEVHHWTEERQVERTVFEERTMPLREWHKKFFEGLIDEGMDSGNAR